jgi:hypothetical protein
MYIFIALTVMLAFLLVMSLDRVGVVAGRLMDKTVVARAPGTNRMHLVAAPVLVNSHPEVKRPADLQEWPWIALSLIQCMDKWRYCRSAASSSTFSDK